MLVVNVYLRERHYMNQEKYLTNMFFVELNVMKLQTEQLFFPCIVSCITVFHSR
jgi:hypothetical protein